MMSDERIESLLRWIVRLLVGIWIVQFSHGCQMNTIQHELEVIHQCEK